jgi:hypothetical protein
MLEHQAVVVAAAVVVGVVWAALMLGALAVLLRGVFPSGTARTRERREPSGRRQSTARGRSRSTGAAPALGVRGGGLNPDGRGSAWRAP